MQAYHDNPFENHSNNSDVDVNYHDPRSTSRSASSPSNGGRVQGPFNSNIPLSVVPTSVASPSVPYTSLDTHTQHITESTDDLTGPTPSDYRNPFGTPPPNRGYGMAAAPYSDTPGSLNSTGVPKLGAYTPGSTWMEPKPQKSNRKRWIIMGTIIGLIAIIVIAIVVGIVVSHSKNNKNLSTTTTSASANSSVQQTDPNDPSKFTKDSSFHQSFYGMAYTPVGSQLPDCGNSLAAVIQDIQIMSQLTSRIRLYGADCNQSALVLEAINQTKVNMTVWLGNYVIATDNNAAYERQRDVLKSAIQTYGTANIGGVTVGNEFMLNYLNANGATDPNSAVGNTGAAILISDIQDTRSMLSSIGVSLPVGNSDAGSYFNNEVLAAVDFGLANVHPWFANVSVDVSAAWTADFFQQTDVDLANTLSNKPTMYIAETGWPTKSSDVSNESNGASTASVANLQTFLDTFVCQANANGTQYFFFEFADEDWKDQQFGGVEGWWGLFNQDRTLKSGLTVPNCQSP